MPGVLERGGHWDGHHGDMCDAVLPRTLTSHPTAPTGPMAQLTIPVVPVPSHVQWHGHAAVTTGMSCHDGNEPSRQRGDVPM